MIQDWKTAEFLYFTQKRVCVCVCVLEPTTKEDVYYQLVYWLSVSGVVFYL